MPTKDIRQVYEIFIIPAQQLSIKYSNQSSRRFPSDLYWAKLLAFLALGGIPPQPSLAIASRPLYRFTGGDLAGH
jgi:hypothetical protein